MSRFVFNDSGGGDGVGCERVDNGGGDAVGGDVNCQVVGGRGGEIEGEVAGEGGDLFLRRRAPDCFFFLEVAGEVGECRGECWGECVGVFEFEQVP